MPQRAHRRARALAIAGLVATLVVGRGAAGAAPCTEAASCRETLQLTTGGTFPYYRSLRLQTNPEVRRAVIVVHGNQRDADRYYERLVAAATLEGRLADTALLAPSFRARADDPGPGEPYWSKQGWKIGHRSRGAAPVSSFAVMDELLARVCPASRDRFPRLETVVLIGHSAGGQFVNRYAAGGGGCPDAAVEVRYVVMNPSSYLYVDARRPSEGAAGFAVPEAPACADYDDYKYGLGELNRYMRRVGPERIRANLFTRRTFYLAGGEDTRTSNSLDTSCPGNLQGPNRLARHANYRAYRELFAEWTGAVFEVVPGIGHSGSRMLQSDAARRAAFR